MAPLTAARRRALPKSSFAIPSKAPASGSYPLDTENRARNALARSSGKPVAEQVRAAVARKYPGIGRRRQGKKSREMGGVKRSIAALRAGA